MPAQSSAAETLDRVHSGLYARGELVLDDDVDRGMSELSLRTDAPAPVVGLDQVHLDALVELQPVGRGRRELGVVSLLCHHLSLNLMLAAVVSEFASNRVRRSQTAPRPYRAAPAGWFARRSRPP